MGRRRQRVTARGGLVEAAAQLVERRLGCGVHLSLPGRSHTWRDHHSKFLGVSRTKAAANAQPEGVTRRIFFDPSLSFDPTTLESRSSAGAEVLALAHKKWSAQLSYFSTMTEMDRRHKRFDAYFFAASVRRRANCQGGAI
jgi:hypothetical protein